MADINPQLNEINTTATKQSGLASTLLGKLQSGFKPYQDQMSSATQAGLDASRSSAKGFLNDIGHSSDELGENLSNSLLRRLTQANQATTGSLRENLAATGGLQRGGADAAFADNSRKLSSDLFEGNNNIVQQQLQARQAALSQAQSVDQNVLSAKLGIDTNTLAAIYSSGRQDLIDETNSLLGIDTNRSNNTLNTLTYGNNQDMAQRNADQNATAGLVGAAGTAVGAYFGGPGGAAAGGAAARGAVGGDKSTTVPQNSFNSNQLKAYQDMLKNSTLGRGQVQTIA